MIDRIRELISKIGVGKYRDGSSQREGWLYHSLPFEELSDVPVHKRTLRREFERIFNDIELPIESAIDVGSGPGLHSILLSQAGVVVECWEADPAVSDLLEAIKEWKGMDSLTIHAKPVTEFTSFPDVDVGLCMNVWHWIVKQRGEHAANTVLENMSLHCKRVYFQVPTAAHFATGFLHGRVYEYLREIFPGVVCLGPSDGHGTPRDLYRCTGERAT